MKEVWRYIKGTEKKYQVSNFGRVKSKKRKYVKFDILLKQRLKGQRLYVTILKSNNKRSHKSVAQLVLKHFKKAEIGKKYALHMNYNTLDNKSRNLNWGTFGDLKRMSFEAKKKKRGVYKSVCGKKKWRAVIKINNKVETVGYFKEKVDAEFAYCEAYEKEYGRRPY